MRGILRDILTSIPKKNKSVSCIFLAYKLIIRGVIRMIFKDEKDYIMRIVKEMVRVLFSLMFGKKYVSVELEDKNKYEVSGKKLKELLAMADNGEINEAENIVLNDIDYNNKDEVAAAALFYQYLSEKDNDFLVKSNYSKEEVLDGLKHIVEKSGYGDLESIMDL